MVEIVLKTALAGGVILLAFGIFLTPEAEPGLALAFSAPAVISLAIFAGAYFFVILEDKIHLQKSKPMLISAGLIWTLAGFMARELGIEESARETLLEVITEYAQLMLFMIVAMSYVSALEERNFFNAFRDRIANLKVSYVGVLWLVSLAAFVISPIVDNLTAALVIGSVVLAIGKESPRFMAIACVSVVVAANAGGAFSPFGDITTLMVWQAGRLEFQEFFSLFLPSLVNMVFVTGIMSFFIPKGKPEPRKRVSRLYKGGRAIFGLFFMTIATAVIFHGYFHFPPSIGMLFGLGYLKIYSYYLSRYRSATLDEIPYSERGSKPYSSFYHLTRIEWDTLLFFYGALISIAGLAWFGQLEILSKFLYGNFSTEVSGLAIGIISAVVDNVPLMFVVLEMDPDLDRLNWLLVTLTAGTGGSILATGSAAGVVLLGHARKHYTFTKHLIWAPVILLGYFVSCLFLLYSPF